MPEPKPMQDQFHLLIDGNKASEKILQSTMSVRVEHGLDLPSVCLLRIQDDELEIVDGGDFDIGKELKVEMGSGRKLKTVFEGEVVGLELEPTLRGSMVLVVKSFDKSHRLHRGRKTRSFVQVTDSDIARKIAQEVGLRPDVESTSEVYDYVIQDNRTNYQFLRDRAERIGFSMWVEKGKLHFKKASAQEEQPITLEWGKELQKFHPVLSAGRQVNEVIVRGWDVKEKKAIIGRATKGKEEAEIGHGKSGSETAKSSFGEASAVVVNRPVRTQAEADALAQALCDELSGEFVQAEGETTGTPELLPGKKVEIKNVGKRFGGKYFVTSVVHVISNNAPYRTIFTASGRKAHTFLDLVKSEEEPLRGVAVGIVTNNKDPDGYGRVKVKFPWLDDKAESWWARIATPMAGKGRGFFFLPEVGDEVLVAFEHGDIRHPYVVGSVWNGKDGLPDGADGAVDGSGKVVRRIIRSRAGHTIILDDDSGGGGVTIRDKKGNEVVMDSAHDRIKITSKGDLTIQAGGKVVIKGDGGVEIETQQKYTVKGSMGVELEAPQGQASLKGMMGISIESSAGNVGVKGLIINLN